LNWLAVPGGTNIKLLFKNKMFIVHLLIALSLLNWKQFLYMVIQGNYQLKFNLL